MQPKTIRRNQIKAITDALKQCVVITSYKYDDMDTSTNKGPVTVDEVMALAGDFDRVYARYAEDGALMEIHVSINRNHSYTGYANADYAKSALTDCAFAKYFPEIAAAERAEAEAQAIAAAAIERAADAARLRTLITSEVQPIVFLGQRIIAKFAALNKNGSLAEYIRECSKPEFGEQIWDRTKWIERPNWRATECKVGKIVTLSAQQYDVFVRTLMDSRPEFFAGFSGGSASDYDPGREIEEIWQMTAAELSLWRAQSYSVVMWVQAPGRASFVVNPEGYDYARYAGIYPTVLGK